MDLFTLLNSVITELTAAAIGAGIGGVCVIGGKRYSEYLIEKRYSLSGEYKAYYDDVVAGEAVVQSDTITLKQKAYHISGNHETSDGTRAWTLEGEIDKKTGHIHGTYKAKTHTDRGMGVFIFEQKEDGSLDGIWAGYDDQNRNIQSGKYTLRKNLNIKIKEGKPEHVARILLLSCDQLGEDYLSADEITFGTDEFLYVAEYEGKIVGFALSKLIEKDGFKKHLLGHKYKIPADIKVADQMGKMGFIQSVAVDEDFQKRGIGQKLVQKCIDAMTGAGVASIFTLGWKTENKVHIWPILQKQRFRQRTEFQDFWREESIEQQYTCPECGDPPCTCEAILYTKAV